MPLPDWALLQLSQSSATLVSCHASAFAKTVETLAPVAPVLVALQLRGHSGSAAQRQLDAQVERWRHHPGVGTLFVSAHVLHVPVARTLHLHPATPAGAVAAHLFTLRKNMRENFEAGRETTVAPATAIKRGLRTLPKGVLSNINIKHPGMLIPIGRVAHGAASPVWVEISPYEAAFYYTDAGKTLRPPAEAAAAVLKQMRHYVNLARKITGADLRLHLDHAHDMDLIRAALDSGFDSVMADASTRPLEANIRFVDEAMRLAEGYQVPVEAELGDLDATSSRNFGQTTWWMLPASWKPSAPTTLRFASDRTTARIMGSNGCANACGKSRNLRTHMTKADGAVSSRLATQSVVVLPRQATRPTATSAV